MYYIYIYIYIYIRHIFVCTGERSCRLSGPHTRPRRRGWHGASEARAPFLGGAPLCSAAAAAASARGEGGVWRGAGGGGCRCWCGMSRAWAPRGRPLTMRWTSESAPPGHAGRGRTYAAGGAARLRTPAAWLRTRSGRRWRRVTGLACGGRQLFGGHFASATSAFWPLRFGPERRRHRFGFVVTRMARSR